MAHSPRSLAEPKTALETAQLELARSQNEKTRTEIERLKAPFWTDWLELFKFAGAASGLLIVLAGGYLQISGAVLTAKNAKLEGQIKQSQVRLDAIQMFGRDLQKAPRRLIEQLSGPLLVNDIWKKEKISDAYIVLGSLDVGCNDYDAALNDFKLAEDNDQNKFPDFHDIEDHVKKMKKQFEEARDYGQSFDACAEPTADNDPYLPTDSGLPSPHG